MIVPARTSGYISAHWRGHKCSQVFVGSVLLIFKSGRRTNESDFMESKKD